MFRITRLAAVAAAVASLAAVSAAPAGAQVDIAIDPNPCLADPGLPQCPQYVINVADRTVQYARYTYDSRVQPVVNDAACVVVETLTTRTCD